MKAKILSFDEVLDSIKSDNIRNIQKLSTEEIGSLLRDIKDKIFIQA